MTDSITASPDDIELALSQVWQRLLGLDQVDAQTDFFDSGGHSLLAVRLFTEIRKLFKIDFGLSTLFEARTVGALAGLIRKARETDGTPRSTTGARKLIPIRSRGSKPPLFLIHDVSGSVLRYEHLARHLPDDQPVYAIESRGLSESSADYTVEKMALHYIRKIQELQPHGPYFVVGHSFGGLVTYEIGRQFSILQEPMGLVGLLDTYQRSLNEDDLLDPRGPRQPAKLPRPQHLVRDIKKLIVGPDRIGFFQDRKHLVRLLVHKKIHHFAYKMSVRFGRPMPSFLKDVEEANWTAADHYMPEPYDGTVVLFRCLNRVPTDPPDSFHVWQRLAKGGVVIREVPGDHNSILREPGVKVLAEQIASYFKLGADVPSEMSAP